MAVAARPRSTPRPVSPAPVDGPGPVRGTLRHAVALVAWLGLLGVVLAGSLALGQVDALSTPPLGEPQSLAGWAAGRQPVEAAVAVLRLVVVALALYLLLATVAAVVARVWGAGRLVTAIDVVTLPWVRRTVQGAVGVGLVGATLASATSALAAPGVAMSFGHARSAQVADAGSEVAAPGGGDDAVDRAPPTLRRLDPPPTPDAPPSPDPTPLPAPAPDPASAPDPAGVPAGASTEVVVDAGDHLWSLAEGALRAAWGRAPSDAEVVGYWEQVVEGNRARLADPANPDLVFPGQSLVLPPVPGAPAP